MNRRSILSSLSSMLVAALAWSRQAEASESNLSKVAIAYALRVKNGLVVDGVVVPGQYPVNVAAYGSTIKTTLPGGQVGEWKEVSKYSPTDAKIEASSTSTPPKTAVKTISQQPLTIYVLVNIASPGEAPTITLAPKGVTF